MPTTTTVLSADPGLHLLRRATYGATPDELDDLDRLGPDGWLDRQLDPEGIEDDDCDALLARFPYVNASVAQLNALSTPVDASNQLVRATLARQIWSKRQLFEVMVEFWTNHFNVLCPNPATYREKVVEDRTVIRSNALGRFETMLVADGRSPAMLRYLMNDESDASANETPNENYGRELLQLHTVTTASGYSEVNVVDSARVLSGRGTDGKCGFLYSPEKHFVGRVRILGWSSPNASATGGLAVGDSYLRYLARHENTARNIATKLCVRFVSDSAPPSLVDRLADVYLDSGTAIVPMLRTLFTSTEFADSIGQKAKRPSEDVVSAARAIRMRPPLTGTLQGLTDLVNHCRRFGQPPLGAEPPTGYPDVLTRWWSVGSTLGRCNAHRGFSRGQPTGLGRPNLTEMLAGPPLATYGEMIDRLSASLCQQTLRSDHRAALLTYAGLGASAPYVSKTGEKWLPDFVELILNSPYRTLR